MCLIEMLLARPRVRRPASARTRARLLALSIGLGLFGAAHARAQPNCVESLDDDQVRELADAIDARLPSIERRTRIYFWSFLSFQGMSAIGATILAFEDHPPALHANYVWGAAGASFGTVMMLAPPLPGAFARRRIGRRPAGDPSLLRDYVIRALDLLDQAAHVERTTRSPWVHVGTAAFALGEGLQIGLTYDHALSLALANSIGSLAFGELQIWTSPRISERTRVALHRRACVGSGRSQAHLDVYILPSVGGVTTAIRW